jgi:hypothetical protein
VAFTAVLNFKISFARTASQYCEEYVYIYIQTSRVRLYFISLIKCVELYIFLFKRFELYFVSLSKCVEQYLISLIKCVRLCLKTLQ